MVGIPIWGEQSIFDLLSNFFESVWSLIETFVLTVVELFKALWEFISFPVTLVGYLPSIVGVGVTIAVAISVLKVIGGRS